MTYRVLSMGISTLLLAGVLHAQEGGGPAEISSMTVDIWPEYDDPRVLVIEQGELAPAAEVPTGFSFLVPEGAQVHMAGGVTEDGKHVHAQFRSVQRDDGLTEISYTLDVPHFYMEFYYDPFAGGEERDFAYPLVSPHPIEELSVRVQQPRRAEGFSVAPFTRQVVQDEKGFVYHLVRWDTLSAGMAKEVAVRYRKADREPSVSPPEPAQAAAAPAVGWSPERILLISGLLLMALAGYGIVVWSKGSDPEPEPAPAKSRGAASASPPPAGAQRHCTHCGGAVAPAYRYCAVCGEPTRGATVA